MFFARQYLSIGYLKEIESNRYFENYDWNMEYYTVMKLFARSETIVVLLLNNWILVIWWSRDA